MKISNVFLALENAPPPKEKKIIILRGGSRAGKTFAVMQKIAVWLLTGYWSANFSLKKGKCDVMRKFRKTLKDSAYKDFKEILETLPSEGVKVHKTELKYSLEGTEDGEFFRREVWFIGLDDEHKVRGPSRDIGFINEADNLVYDEEFLQVLMRTNRLLLLDFNPSDPYTWIKSELEDKRALEEGDVLTLVSNHEDNPFLTDSLRREIMNIKDPELAKVYRDGKYGVVKGLVFPSITIVSRMPEGLKRVGIGLDFGFSNDPTAAVICGVLGDSIFLRVVLYEVDLFTKDIYEALAPYGLPVIADSADPKTIKELKHRGLRIRPAKKGADSIRNGIALLKSYDLCVTSDSEALKVEQRLYKYPNDAKRKKGVNPIDRHNHCWDAIRYWAQYYLSKVSDSAITAKSRTNGRR